MYIFISSFLYIIKCIFASNPINVYDYSLSLCWHQRCTPAKCQRKQRSIWVWIWWHMHVFLVPVCVCVCVIHTFIVEWAIWKSFSPFLPLSNHKNCPSQYGQGSQGGVPGRYPSQRHGTLACLAPQRLQWPSLTTHNFKNLPRASEFPVLHEHPCMMFSFESIF